MLSLHPTWLWMSLFIAIGLAPRTAFAVDPEITANELKAVVEANFAAANKEDLKASMSVFHTESPSLVPTRDASKELFELYDLRMSLVEFEYIGADEMYAVARVKQKSEKVKGPEFRNNVLDAMWIFRQEAGKWKFWTSTTLELKFLGG